MSQVLWGRPGVTRKDIAEDLGADCEPHTLDAIETSPAELDATKSSTEAGGMFAAALFGLAIAGALFGAWLLNTIARAAP